MSGSGSIGGSSVAASSVGLSSATGKGRGGRGRGRGGRGRGRGRGGRGRTTSVIVSGVQEGEALDVNLCLCAARWSVFSFENEVSCDMKCNTCTVPFVKLLH